MPRRKIPARPAAAQENILRAAAEEFAERGFEGARVDEIARRAGVNKAMLYYHVGDKAALYERIVHDAVSAVTVELQERLGLEATPEGKLLAIARAFEAVGRAKPFLPRIMLREIAMGGRDLPSPTLVALGQVLQIEADILSKARRSGHFRQTDVISLHILLVGGTMLHLVSRGMRERIRGAAMPELPEPTKGPAEAVTDLLLEGLRSRRKTANAPNTRPQKRRHKETQS